MKKLVFLLLLLPSFLGFSQVLMSGPGSYSQNFDGLINTGTSLWADNSTIPSWYSQRVTGTGFNIIAGAGAANTGGLYSFGTGTNTDRAIGSVCSGGTGAQAVGVQFQNTTMGALGSFNVSYTMEQWRNGGNVNAQPLAFYYQVSSSAITALTPANNGSWTAVTTLNALTPTNTATAAALDGDAAANRVLVSGTIPGLTLAAGEFLMLKWDDVNDSGNDHGISVDDFSITWSTSCNTASTISVNACNTYTVPSGDETYTTSGSYTDTIPNAAMCDSVITINLTINNPTTATISPVACGSYTVPSGDETYFTSGTYMDTIPNFQGCDSILTINLTISGSIIYYQDLDNDGFGNPFVSQNGCAPIAGYVTNSDDCNDNDANIGIGATWYADTDQDGFGNNNFSVTSCLQPPGYVADNTDCDDNDNTINGPIAYFADFDGDGFGNAAVSQISCTQPLGYITDSTDCDDTNNQVYPGAIEIPNNGIDEDCSGADLNTLGTVLAEYIFTGHTCATPSVSVTTQPTNAVFSDYASDSVLCASGTDFFNNSGWNTTAVLDTTEYLSFAITPNNCFGLNLSQLKWLHRLSNSAGTPTVHIRSSLDSYAADIATITGITTGVNVNETLNLPSQFQNITGSVEFRFYITSMGTSGATYRHDNMQVIGFINPLAAQTYYQDLDGDSFGNNAVTLVDCTQPLGYVLDNTDCVDTDANQFPGAIWFADADNDGFGNALVSLTQCTQPAGYVSDNTDCNDNDNAVTGSQTWFVDADGDSFGDATATGVVSCTPILGSVTNALDCDDNNANTYPNAIEICDGLDNNCDNNIDEGLTTVVYYEDADSDGFGNAAVSITDCVQPVGYVTDSTDCDDTNFAAYPGALEVLNNGIDENCDGTDNYLSIGESALATLSVFPNPGNASVTLTVMGGFESYSIAFVSVDGKTVDVPTAVTASESITFNTEKLVPGTYFIRIAANTESFLVRWVKN